MGKKYKIKVNNSSEFDLTEEQVEELNVVKEADSNYHILNGNRAIKAEVTDKDFDNRLYSISLNPNTYQIKILTPLDQLIAELGFSLGNSKKLNDIKAPMPGIIIDIEVNKGDEVQEGDTLFILEAMKMENAITSPKDGKIKEIFVNTGETVEKNKLLIELE